MASWLSQLSPRLTRSPAYLAGSFPRRTPFIMAVPGHDARDSEFARQFDLPIIEVVSGGKLEESAFAGEGTSHQNAACVPGALQEGARAAKHVHSLLGGVSNPLLANA